MLFYEKFFGDGMAEEEDKNSGIEVDGLPDEQIGKMM